MARWSNSGLRLVEPRSASPLASPRTSRPDAAEGLRGLAVVHGNVHRAARLIGAASAHRYGQPTDPVDAWLDAAFFEPTRTGCGNDAWNTTLRDGAALSFEDAIVYALEETSE